MSTQPYHIFFIASWLPSLQDAFEGDFILRHAQAIALQHKVSVAYVIESDLVVDANWIEDEEHHENLHIYRIYLHSKYKKIWNKHQYYKTIELLYHKINSESPIQIIQANVHWRAGYSAYLLFKKYKTPYVICEHSGYFNTAYYKYKSINTYSLLKKYMVRKALVHAAYCLPVSQYLATWLQIFDKRIKTKVISNVVEDQQFGFTISKSIQPFIFMHASMAWPEKNVATIIEAAALLAKERNDFQIYFYIPKVDKPNLQLDTDIIKYKGTIAHQEMPAAIQNSHANILYSDVETQGCIIIESLCCGRPLIVSNATVFSEMITDGINGLQSVDTSAIGLKILMAKMIDNYYVFDKEQISKNAIEKYGMQSISDAFDKVYDKVCNR